MALGALFLHQRFAVERGGVTRSRSDVGIAVSSGPLPHDAKRSEPSSSTTSIVVRMVSVRLPIPCPPSIFEWLELGCKVPQGTGSKSAQDQHPPRDAQAGVEAQIVADTMRDGDLCRQDQQ